MVARGRGDRFTQDVFRSLPEPEQALIDRFSLRTVALVPNRDLISEGEVGVGLFQIVNGWAYRFRREANGAKGPAKNGSMDQQPNGESNEREQW